MKNKTILMILDGWGHGINYEGNAILKANTPNFNRLIKEYPNTLIRTSGYDVGLPEGQMGNSEVGHMNIGAGRIVYQELTRITKSFETGEAKNNPEINRALENAVRHHKKLHLMGLLSDGGVHSHNSHLYGLLTLAKEKGLTEVYIHCFMDGRDVPPNNGIGYVKELMAKIDEIGLGQIASIMGRYYAMDRDKRWERTQLAYEAMISHIGLHCKDPVAAVETSYSEGVNDEFIKPIIIDEKGMIEDGDSVIFFNFRPDRARQITRAIVDDGFDAFERKRVKTEFVCLTQYDITINHVSVAYKPQFLKNTLGEYISQKGLKQLRLAETEKYAHVTFFFNGGVEKSNKGEERILIPSPKVATYDLKPEMSAYEVKDTLLRELEKQQYDVVIVNFANPDMVGHTGIMSAAIKAVEVVDECLGEIATYVIKNNINLIVTADHGNAEEMLDENHSVLTQHTTNKVPLILISTPKRALREGILADIAPTILDLQDIEKPLEMTGHTLIEKQI
ncbi:MAG: 2,3-bisphosphoglycerate-independent phosphoglycerate mutase [Tissierellales bacterium]|nr:2,3-bisphosphoglycerate-independent phosphoglycerate mutase [Tissierellales bacterium]MBN2826807.1 2,3-bisphosphoglycerate-independent phosphoglycerate mutase [Tissierellales bacterium]